MPLGCTQIDGTHVYMIDRIWCVDAVQGCSNSITNALESQQSYHESSTFANAI